MCAECDDGRYGPECMLECRCENGGRCHPATGECECTPGWHGKHCSTKCRQGQFSFIMSFTLLYVRKLERRSHNSSQVCMVPTNLTSIMMFIGVGWWGKNCSQMCECQHEGTCHHVTGECSCPHGYTGHNCQTGEFVVWYIIFNFTIMLWLIS